MATIKAPFVRNPYNYDVDKASHETALRCEDESLTQQQFLEESDINYIAERFMKTGEMPQVLQMPTAGDFGEIFDFQSAMNLIKHAKDEFMTLPAKVRSRFDNDPAKLINFLEDTDNRDEAIALGLIPKPEPKDEPLSLGSTKAGEQGETRTAGTPGAKDAPQPTQKPGPKAGKGD